MCIYSCSALRLVKINIIFMCCTCADGDVVDVLSGLGEDVPRGGICSHNSGSVPKVYPSAYNL